MSERPIPNSYWVVPGKILAGEYPVSPFNPYDSRQRLEAFLAAGIDTFINLTTADELVPYEPDLTKLARIHDLEVEHHRFSIGDFGIPSQELMTSILDTIDNSLSRGRMVYVHCWGGIGRTGTTVGCYLVRQGMSGKQALEQIAKWWQEVPKRVLHPRSPETDRQVEFILGWETDPKKRK